jgi:hypothetical protein
MACSFVVEIMVVLPGAFVLFSVQNIKNEWYI